MLHRRPVPEMPPGVFLRGRNEGLEHQMIREL
jgi:hypothetical protein